MRAPAFSAGSGVWLVAGREIRSRLRSKAFVISTAILLLAVLGSVLAGGLFSSSDQRDTVAVVGSAGEALSSEVAKQVPANDVAEAERMVRDGTVDAAVVPGGGEDTAGVTVIARDSAPSALVFALSVPPHVTLLEPDTVNPMLRYFVAIGFGLAFFLSALTFGQTIAQSVVEEKQTRVIEILLSTVSARILLAGKVIGNSLLAFGQIALIALLSTGALVATGQDVLLGNLGASVVWFVVFFTFGFVLIASLYAATAALVSRQEEVGSATSPVMILVMIPYVLVIVFNDNPVVLAVMSYVPFSAPVGMPMRLFAGEAQWWEPLVSLAVLLLTTAGAILLGARVYSGSLLRIGARVRLGEALRG